MVIKNQRNHEKSKVNTSCLESIRCYYADGSFLFITTLETRNYCYPNFSYPPSILFSSLPPISTLLSMHSTSHQQETFMSITVYATQNDTAQAGIQMQKSGELLLR
jgi:hypothetical protein